MTRHRIAAFKWPIFYSFLLSYSVFAHALQEAPQFAQSNMNQVASPDVIDDGSIPAEDTMGCDEYSQCASEVIQACNGIFPCATATLFGEGAAYRIARGLSVVAYIREVGGVGPAIRHVFDADSCDARGEHLPGVVRVSFECSIVSPHIAPDDPSYEATIYRVSARLDLTVADPGTLDVEPSIQVLPPNLGVEEVGVQVVFADDIRGSHLLIPAFTGYVMDDPVRELPSFRTRLNHGESVQATAFYHDDGSGVLAFAVDPRGTQPKQFEFYSHGERSEGKKEYGTEMAILWTASNSHVGGGPVVSPFTIRFVPFAGDWYDSAQIYRKWIQRDGQDGILRRGKLIDRTDVPDWLIETDVLFFDNGGWYTGDHSSSEQMRQYANLASELGADQSLLGLWEWMDPDDPDAGLGGYRPRPGLSDDLFYLEAQGVRSLGYTRFLSFSSKHSAFPELQDYLCQDRYGELTGNPLEVDADLSSPFWVEYYSRWAAEARGYTGLSAIFHDNVAANQADFVRPHGGDLGHTASAYEGMGEIAWELGESVPSGFASFHEVAMERLIPTMDIEGATNYWHRIVPGRKSSHAVPFFTTVYADYTLRWPADDGFGPLNIASAYLFNPVTMTRVLARGFTYGNLLNTSEFPGPIPLRQWTVQYLVDNNVNEAFARHFISQVRHYYDFLRASIAIRERGRDFLVFGRLLRDPWIAGDRLPVTVAVTYPGNLVGKQETFDEPAIYTTAWQAPDGRQAVVAANPGMEPALATVDLARAGFSDVRELVDEHVGVAIPVEYGQAKLELAPGQILVLEVK
jgi:hypothetical protein